MEFEGQIVFQDIDINDFVMTVDSNGRQPIGAQEEEEVVEEVGLLASVYNRVEGYMMDTINVKIPENKYTVGILSSTGGGGLAAFILIIIFIIICCILAVFIIVLLLLVLLTFTGTVFQMQVNSIALSVEKVDIVQASSSSFLLRTGGSITGSPLRSSASFKTSGLILYYGGIIEMELNLKDEDFVRVGSDGFSAEISLGGVNDSVLNTLAGNFESEDSLRFQLVGTIDVKWTILSHKCVLDKNIEVFGFGGPVFDLNEVQLFNATENEITFNVTVIFHNPSVMSASLSSDGMILRRGNDVLGRLKLNNSMMVPGQNEFAILSSLVRGNATDQFFSDILANMTIPVCVLSNLTLISSDGSSGRRFSLEHETTIPPQNYEFIESVHISDASISTSLATFDVNITIANPTTLPFNLTRADFSSYFDDPSGFAPFIPPKTDIHLGDTVRVFLPQVHINPLEKFSFVESFTVSSIDTCSRLVRLYAANSLNVDIRDGIVYMGLLDYELQVEITAEAKVT